MMNRYFDIYNPYARTSYRYPHDYAPMPMHLSGRCGCRCGCCPCCCVPCGECGRGPYTVSFVTNGGLPVPPPQVVAYRGMVVRPADPVLPGFIFAGWFATVGFSEAPWDFINDMVLGDMTLQAHWVPAVYQVTFDTNGGVPMPAPQMVPYGGLVTRPEDPTREGYVFIAWYPTPELIGEPWVFGTDVVGGDMTLYARWLEPA